ncbi:MAG: hypothetical protein L6M37_05720 [Candidatus Methylarchaceae archaeon HK02M1]|nr:hypothetical protein [Candidatus Methylarchaceae archaeon HK01M]MCP8312430.1 hypothetical protein [Candidatus Methylarchaceae archaeon HK02M1]
MTGVTKVKVDPGICKRKVLIKVERSGSKAKINITSNCPLVTEFSEKLRELEGRESTRNLLKNIVYRISSESLHSTCPVPCAILKAIEVEFGFAAKRNVKISFID